MIPAQAVLKDIKPPVYFPRDYTLLAILAALALIAAIVFLALFIIKKIKAGAYRNTPLEVKPAHRIAYEALEALKKKRLVEEGKIREFYYELSFIVRQYLENRFNLRAPEMTTGEFLDALKYSAELTDAQKELLKMEVIRVNKYATRLLGPEYPPAHKRIEIDTTYCCNRRCDYCNRFIELDPPVKNITIDQIKKFIKESIELNRKWEIIYLSGGEPILHPRIFEIVDLVLAYKKQFSPDTVIKFLTNGIARDKFSLLPKEIQIIDSEKDIKPFKHYSVTRAPADLPEYANADYSNACYLPRTCGMGLNMYGYYQCTAAGAIDRVFGFNAGRKKLPDTSDNMTDLCGMFCRYCSYFLRATPSSPESITPSWQAALSRYKSAPPSLTLY